MKKRKIIFITILIISIVLIGLGITLISITNRRIIDSPIIPVENEEYEFSNYDYYIINNYNEYLNKIDEIKEKSNVDVQELSESDFKDSKYVYFTYEYNSCGENTIKDSFKIEGKNLKLYYNVESRCGVCAPMTVTDCYKLDKNSKFDEVKAYYKITSRQECNINVAYKPLIYIYPKEDIDLTIKFKNTHLLTHTYPKYKDSWNVHVNKNSNIYDYDTKRNYYGLYWEAIDNTSIDMKEGFIVKGSDTVKFLEEKLSILGLNEREINEFIIYWIDKLENNNYNYIYFRTTDEVNKYMPLEFSEEPDTLIRVIMDFKPLDKKINVKEQQLSKQDRIGFTVVEWGGVIH